MPVLDGRDFLAAWRDQPAEHGAPVVVMSASAGRLSADDLGAAAFLPKPFDAATLVAILDGMV